MRIIRISLFALLALSLIACTGIFIFFQTFDTDQYLNPITNKFSLALGRPVSIGHLGLGLSEQGITLDTGPLVVADDVDFTKQVFIKVDRVRISLDLGSLILRRKIDITGILLQSPQIHFIRSQEGRFNVGAIINHTHREEGHSASSSFGNVASSLENAPHNDTRIKEHTFLSAINVKSIKIQDASISFIDQSQSMPLDIWLNNINVSLNDFSLSKPFQLALSASLYSHAPNVHIGGLVTLDLSKRSLQISDVKSDVDLSQVDSNRFKDIFPGDSDSSMYKNIAGRVQLSVNHLGMGATGDITASGGISITDGIIKNFNIIKIILSHTLGSFTGMRGNIDQFLNGSLKDQLGAQDTLIEKAEVQFSFHDKTAFIDNSLVQTNIFELTAKGSIDQGLNVDMQTMLHLNNDVSAALINELEGLQSLCDDGKRIAIGASLKGVFPHLKYKPNKDFRKKSKRFLMEDGGDILGVLLGGGQKISSGGQDGSSQDQGKRSKRSFKNMFKSFLQ